MKETQAQITAQINVARADADKRLTDALTRRDAVIAEERASVAAMVAQAESDIPVQKARLEQVKRRLEADVIQPAKAECEAAELKASADVAPIIKEADPELEARMNKEEELERSARQHHETPHFRAGDE